MASAHPRPPIAPHGSVTGHHGDARARVREAGAARWPDRGRIQQVTACAGLVGAPLAAGRGFAGRDGPASVRTGMAWERHDQAPKRLRTRIACEPPLSLA